MRVAIITEDNFLVVDGQQMRSDCSELVAQQIRAVQWYDTEGEVEHIGHIKPNEKITDFSPYQVYVDNAVPLQPPEPTINPALNSLRPKTIANILLGV